MARPSKTNIGNFPFDVDFFDNKIMVRIAGEYGVKGEIIAIKLLCAVYRQGYFMKWSIDERAIMLRYLPGISPDLLDQVLDRLLRWGFFEKGLFESAKILTSVEIQRNYFLAIKRRTVRKAKSFPFMLLDPEHPKDSSCYIDISVNRNSDSVDDNHIHVIQKSSDNSKGNLKENSNDLSIKVAEKEFLHTETPVSVYKNPGFCNKNPDSGGKNPRSCNKNHLEERFGGQKEVSATKKGVSVYKNPGLCIQKPDTSKNNNPNSDNNNGVSVDNNSVSVYNNGQTDDKNPVFDSNNPANIIYNTINSSSNSRSSLLLQKIEEKEIFGEQKGRKGIADLEEDIQNLLKEEIWMNSFCKMHNLEKHELPDLLDRFKNHCISDGKIDHPSYNETKSHLGSWTRIQQSLNYSNTKTHGNTENQTGGRDKRRGTPANSKKVKNYDASF